MDDIEYTYTVDEITDDGSVAQVTYVPHHQRLKAVTLAVSIPLHKARDEDHAAEILHQKCRQRAPVNDWLQVLALEGQVERPPIEAMVESIRSGEVGREQRVERPRPESREEQLRRRYLAGE